MSHWEYINLLRRLAFSTSMQNSKNETKKHKVNKAETNNTKLFNT